MSMVGRSVAALPNSFIGSQAGTTNAEKSPGTFSGMPADLHRMRVIFPDRWSAFLRNHFRNARHVQFFFDVDDRTARNWWTVSLARQPSLSSLRLASTLRSSRG